MTSRDGAAGRAAAAMLLCAACGPASVAPPPPNTPTAAVPAATAPAATPAPVADPPADAAPAAGGSHACDRQNLTDCRDRCSEGDGTSCFYMATLLQRGSRIGGPEERELMTIYQRVCDGQGPHKAEACGRLAYLLHLSPSLKNETRALEHGKKACELGSPLGCLFLAREDRSAGWRARLKSFERACSLGDKTGCVEGGVVAVEGRDAMPPETALGLKMLDGACSSGDPEACAHLAFLYDRGSVKGGKATEVKPDAARFETFRRRYCELVGKSGEGIKCP